MPPKWTAGAALMVAANACGALIVTVGLWRMAPSSEMRSAAVAAALFTGALVAWRIVWLSKGTELVTVGADAISVRREAFGLGRTRHYDARRIRELRVEPLPEPRRFGVPDHASCCAWDGLAGPLAFDYTEETVRFGAVLSVHDATAVLRELTSADLLPKTCFS
jgi:hypothetical protein